VFESGLPFKFNSSVSFKPLVIHTSRIISYYLLTGLAFIFDVHRTEIKIWRTSKWKVKCQAGRTKTNQRRCCRQQVARLGIELSEREDLLVTSVCTTSLGPTWTLENSDRMSNWGAEHTTHTGPVAWHQTGLSENWLTLMYKNLPRIKRYNCTQFLSQLAIKRARKCRATVRHSLACGPPFCGSPCSLENVVHA